MLRTSLTTGVPEVKNTIKNSVKCQNMIWDPDAVIWSCTVCWTEYADLLPSPLPFESENFAAIKTIKSNPYLFNVSTSINHFEGLLS